MDRQAASTALGQPGERPLQGPQALRICRFFPHRPGDDRHSILVLHCEGHAYQFISSLPGISASELHLQREILVAIVVIERLNARSFIPLTSASLLRCLSDPLRLPGPNPRSRWSWIRHGHPHPTVGPTGSERLLHGLLATNWGNSSQPPRRTYWLCQGRLRGCVAVCRSGSTCPAAEAAMAIYDSVAKASGRAPVSPRAVIVLIQPR